MRRSRTGSKLAMLFLVQQLVHESIELIRGEVDPMFVIDQGTRCALASADALGEFQAYFAIAGGAAGSDAKFLRELSEQLVRAAKHAGQAAANPDAGSTQWVLFIAEETVKTHCVVDFRRAEVQQI